MTDKSYGRMQWRVLIATMIGYTLFYFMRKNFSFAMPGLEQDCGITKSQLGNFLFAGGIVYGLSKFLNGFIGDRVNSRKMLCFGLLVCTLINVAFGFVPDFAEGRAMLWAFGALLVLNQFFQGTGFPPCARLIAFWVPPKELATKMSFWNCSHSIGGGFVAKVCGVIMGLGVLGAANQGVGMWKWCFWTMSILGALGLAAMWFWLPGTPEEEGFQEVEVKGGGGEKSLSPSSTSTSNLNLDPQSGVMRTVFLSPAVWLLGITNLTVNAARALVADWGPTMLQEAKHLTPSEAGTYIMFFEFAGIAGMLVGGWVTDRFARGRVPRVCVFMMTLAAVALAGFWKLPAGVASVVAFCAFGFMLYGPQALTGVAVTNLCGKHCTGTSIGFISLFSYVGASLSGKICGMLAQSAGTWRLPVTVIGATVAVGAAVFLMLWGLRFKRIDP